MILEYTYFMDALQLGGRDRVRSILRQTQFARGCFARTDIGIYRNLVN
jgi:hypothetical protein